MQRSKKKVAPAPKSQVAPKKEVVKKTWKESHAHLFINDPRNFRIGNDIQPKRDLTRFVKWPKYVRLQRQRAILKRRLKVPPAINQFAHTLDKNHAANLFRLLSHYRPETLPEKKKRLIEQAKTEVKGAAKEKAAKAEKGAAKEKDKEGKDKEKEGKDKEKAAPKDKAAKDKADKGKEKGKDKAKDKPKDKPKEKEEAKTKDSGKSEKTKPYFVKYGLNHITRLVEKRKAKLVVLAHDVDPVELVVWLPALCRKLDIPYCIVKSKARLGQLVHLKNAAAIAVTDVRKEDQSKLDQIVQAVKPQFNDNVEALKRWGGGTLGRKAEAIRRKREKLAAREAKKANP